MPAKDGASVFQPHWGDDGTIVFAWSDSLYRVPDTGGTPVGILGDLQNPHILPGGAGLLASETGTFTTYFLAPGQDTAVVLILGGIAARYVETGHILYGEEQGGLWALPFDLAAGQKTGEATPILQGVSVQGNVLARYDVSQNGTLVYGLGTEAGGNADPLMLYEYNVVVGSMPHRLTTDGAINNRPAWSPDGTQIAFTSSREERLGRNLYLKNVFDDSPPQLTLIGMSGNGRARADHWLKDDLLVITNGSSGSLNNIWTMTVPDTTTAKPYISAEGNRVWARVAPPRDLAAYETDETGRREIFVHSFPVARQPTPVSTGGGVSPAWSPDGNKIYYWRASPGEDSLFAATIQRDPVFAVLSTEFVFAGDYKNPADWDLHPDGDRFITARIVRDDRDETGAPVDVEPERHLIVTNWFTELLAATGGGSRR